MTCHPICSSFRHNFISKSIVALHLFYLQNVWASATSFYFSPKSINAMHFQCIPTKLIWHYFHRANRSLKVRPKRHRALYNRIILCRVLFYYGMLWFVFSRRTHKKTDRNLYTLSRKFEQFVFYGRDHRNKNAERFIGSENRFSTRARNWNFVGLRLRFGNYFSSFKLYLFLLLFVDVPCASTIRLNYLCYIHVCSTDSFWCPPESPSPPPPLKWLVELVLVLCINYLQVKPEESEK